MPDIKVLPKRNQEEVFRNEQQARIKLFDKTIGSRSRLSDLNEKVRYAINQFMKEIDDPAVKKTVADFNREFERVIDLQDNLSAAQKTQKNLADHYYNFNRAMFDLAGTEIGILTSIESGLSDAVEAESSLVIEKINKSRVIEQNYAKRIDQPIRTMGPEQKKAYSKDRAVAKAEMLKEIRALDIKTHRLGSLAEIKAKQSKINLRIRALNGWCNTYFPVPKNLTALQTVDMVDRMVREKSISQAHGAELKNA